MRISSIIIRSLIVAAAIFANAMDAMAWGQKGHDIVCAIAERHLTPKARKQISKSLDGRSMVYWASWLDNASHTPEYSYTKTWHYLDINPGEELETMERESSGDVLTGIREQIEKLSSGSPSKEEEALSLKILIHLVGDMHCPMHMGHKDDLGGNRWQVRFFDDGSNLHKVWDEGILESGHKWSCDEWVRQLDIYDRKTNRDLASGTPEEWCKDMFGITSGIYDATPVGIKISYDYVSRWTPLIEQQLLKGGLRLAKILNDIY